jgi:hypothetical protein
MKLIRKNAEDFDMVTSRANEIKEVIKKNGYWHFLFYPRKPVKDKFENKTAIKELVTRNCVKLRGYSFPFVPGTKTEYQDIYNGNNYVESYSDYGRHKEVWRYYQSGQFIRYLSLWEDGMEDNEAFTQKHGETKPKEILSILNAVYLVTEFFEFLRRIASEGFCKEGLIVKTELFNMQGRKLKILDQLRVPLHGDYTSYSNHIEIGPKNLDNDDLQLKSRESALEFILSIFESFNWDKPPIDTIKNDQKRLLERKL